MTPNRSDGPTGRDRCSSTAVRGTPNGASVPARSNGRSGAKRQPGTREGLTKAQAEEELRRLMREVKATPQERLTLREVGDAYIAHLRDFLERKPSTIQDYGGILNKAEQGLPKKTTDRYDGADIEGYVSVDEEGGPLAEDDQQPPELPPRPLCLRGEARLGVGQRGRRSRAAASRRHRSRHSLHRPGGTRGAPAGGPRRRSRRGRAAALPDRRDDRLAPGRADRPALERRRLEGGPDPRPPQLHPRTLRHPEDEALQPSGPDARARRHRAQTAPQALQLHRRRRSRLLSSRDRQTRSTPRK